MRSKYYVVYGWETKRYVGELVMLGSMTAKNEKEAKKLAEAKYGEKLARLEQRGSAK